MFIFGGSFWVSVSALFLTLFRFIAKIFSRIWRNESSQTEKLNSSSVSVPENAQLDLGFFEEGDEKQMEKSDSNEAQEILEAESLDFFFKFEFQTDTFEKLSGSYRGITEYVLLDSVSSSSTSNYEFVSEKDCIFMEKSEEISFKVSELYVDSDEDTAIHQDSERYVLEETLEDSSIEKEIEEASNLDPSYEIDEEMEESTNDSNPNLEVSKDSIEIANSSDNSSGSGSEDLETLWEHQDLIEQLKIEMKNRTSGLPTIPEEEETDSPNLMKDLKPWKIEEKSQPTNTMSELHKFCKSYKERMRKLDILNYQKMYSIGFFQSKDTFKSISRNKFSSFLQVNSRKRENDSTVKFIRELQIDLEAVYVGQMCLSWEILYWQYKKAIELWESDHYGVRRYNEVASEFQQFQVLIQRFLENEKFEGPRVQNYAKKRCFLRNLLQVPVIREDKGKSRSSDSVTSDMLVEIMEESIRIFWRFVRADKDATVVFHKTRRGTRIAPLEPDDLDLLAEVQTSLYKKDKKLRETLRVGNCIMRRFQKQKEENSDRVLYFFAQVDVKLVARALNMSKVTRDQLLWCHSKLSRIDFVNRKIHVEPSFLLFPC